MPVKVRKVDHHMSFLVSSGKMNSFLTRNLQQLLLITEYRLPKQKLKQVKERITELLKCVLVAH